MHMPRLQMMFWKITLYNYIKNIEMHVHIYEEIFSKA